MIRTMAASAIATLAIVCGAAVQEPARDVNGTAIVKVETLPAGAPGSFVFTGVPGGTTSAGSILEKRDLEPGTYTSVGLGMVSELVLVSITCNDGGSATPSLGSTATRTATFKIDRGETVTCVFRYHGRRLGEKGRTDPAEPGDAGDPDPEEPGDVDEPGEPGGPGEPGEPERCLPVDKVPKAGRWNVTNQTGRMVCGTLINMPLKPSRESGTLEIRDCGWTVVGTGMAQGTAAITMRAVDRTSGRYTGSVGGAQDGIPMTIDFTWQLKSSEWIVGDLKSQVTQGGMTCNMTRPFELKYSGP